MPKNLRNILSWVVYIAVLAILIYGLPKDLSAALDTDFPMASISSGSMWPALKKGDLVLIKGVDGKEDIEIGDVVVYKNPKGFTIHRVVSMGDTTLVTKGDANNTKDPSIKYEDVIGKTLTINDKIFKIPALGNVGLIAQRN